MNDPGSTAPSYLEKCNEMEFDELRSFIERTLEGNENTADLPRFETEFIFLVETLKEKAKLTPPPTPILDKPSDDIIPPEVPEYEPSAEVIELNNKRSHVQQALEEKQKLAWPQTQAERGEQREEKKSLKAELLELDRQIYQLELIDRDRHQARLAAYENEFQAYQEKLSAQAAQSRTTEEASKDRARNSRGSEITKERMKIVSEVRTKVRNAFKLGANVPKGRFSWIAIPQGTLSRERVTRHYKGLYHRGLLEKYDEERLERAYSLNPKRAHLGTGEAEGYVIFTFTHTTKFLMERPEIGNAIFVVDSPEWEDWTLLNKQQLMEHQQVTRIPHQGDWFERVKQVLEIRQANGKGETHEQD